MGAQNTNCTMKFIDIPEDRQREAINTVALQTGLPPSSIEKDWWVTQVLKALPGVEPLEAWSPMTL